MTTSQRLSDHFRQIYFGGNWTCSNLSDQLKDVSWQQATKPVESLNTIATLAFHINYFVDAVAGVLEGKPLDSKDELSFDHPPIASEKDWTDFKKKIEMDGIRLTDLIAGLDESIWDKPFVDGKYGTYFRNIQGVIEHSHYHLGQISLIKKLTS